MSLLSQIAQPPAVTVVEDFLIGAPVPERVASILQASMDVYPQYIEQRLPAAQWYISLAYLGEVENPAQYYSRLRKPLVQAFLPTVQLTHVGRGRPLRQELWAFAEATPVLLGIRAQLVARLKKMRFKFPTDKLRQEYIPHITIGHLFSQVGHLGIADVAAVTSFGLHAVHVYSRRTAQSGTTITIEETIALS